MELSTDEARRLFLAAQGVLAAPDRRAGVTGVLAALGAVQLDTISVLARSHELVAYARLGAVPRPAVEDAYWGGPPRAFEYLAHAACILPLATWPLFAARRRRNQSRYRQAIAARETTRREVLARLASEGPLTATELGGAKVKGTWWSWSEVKEVCELLLAMGTVTCVQRRGWRRVYDLPERVIPAALRDADLDDRSCDTALVAAAGARLGVATREDLADYFRLRLAQVDAVIAAAGLVPVTVAGWGVPAWADPGALAQLETGGPRGRHRTTLLSPFDSLVWDRRRTERIFDFSHRLEAYVPKAKRTHGYFVMPLLAGGRLLARVDPARDGTTLVAHRITVEPRFARRAPAALATALAEAARWVGCDAVRVDVVDLPAVRDPLHAALAESGMSG